MLFMLHVSYHITHTGNYTLGEKKIVFEFYGLEKYTNGLFPEYWWDLGLVGFTLFLANLSCEPSLRIIVN